MRARWHGKPFHDINLQKWIISLECEEPPVEYDKTKNDLLSVHIKKHREKRSLNSNAYFHLLVDKIAEVQESSHTEIHNWLIAEYGQRDTEINDIIMDDEINWKKIDSIHLRPTTATKVLDNGKLYRVYMVMRGSHTYDSKEMGRLIEGTVSEAKELGIETTTPEEIKKMLSMMEVNNGKQK